MMLIDTGNPPFKGQKVTGSIWPALAEKGFCMSDRYFASILPNRWTGHTSNLKGNKRLYIEYFRNTMIVANLGECQHYFQHADGSPISLNGQDYITYVVCDKQRTSDQFVRIITRADDFMYNISQMDFLPCINTTYLDYQIVSKIDAYRRINSFMPFYGMNGLNYKSDGKCRYFIVYAYNLFYDKCFKFFDWGNLTSSEFNRVYQLYALNVIPGMTEESILSIMEHPIVYYYLSLFFMDKIHLGSLCALPFFDLTKIWDEEELLDEMKLNSIEKDRILDRSSSG